MAKTKELSVIASEAALAELRSEFPVEQSFNRILLPRLGMVSQDVTEGKGKAMKVVTEAGTFFIEHQTEEVDEDTGKKTWEREELGSSIEAIILYRRKQLRMYDETTEQYTSSPVYDEDSEILPLFCDKKEVARNTPAELKAIYAFTGEDGKTKSKLEENRILYVLYNDEVYQMNLRGSSMYSFMTYARKTTPNTVVTAMGSESKEKGSIAWNQMTFDVVRPINKKEVEVVLEKTREIKEGIAAEKGFYATKVADTRTEAQKEALNNF